MPNSAHRIERFVHAHLAGRREDATEPHTRLRPFVTISRQAGAGGLMVAEAMIEVFARQEDAELFGEWQVFDQKLCELVAADEGLAGSLDELVAEEYRSRTDEFIRQLLRPAKDQDYVMGSVFRAVRTLAGVGKAIIVGRAGSQVTKGMRPGVSLRLVAPEPLRIARLMELESVGEREARDIARKRDAARARLLRRHFRVDIADPEGYDATWNTATVAFEEIAEAVATMLRRRAAAIRAEARQQ